MPSSSERADKSGQVTRTGARGARSGVSPGTAGGMRGRKRHEQAPMGLAAFGAFTRDLRNGLSGLPKRTSDPHKRVALLIMLAGVLLRVFELRLPLTYDEALTYTHFASRPFSFILSDLTFPVNHVPHTLMVRVSTLLFGVHAWSLRLPDLVAGILVMPLFYLFVRSMFNRYIALITLAFVAGSGCLVEGSALAYGHSLLWLSYITALLLGRHLVKTNNMISALLFGVMGALAIWSMPSSVPLVISLYLWVTLQLMSKYKRSIGARMNMVFWSLVFCALLVFLAILPVLGSQGIGQVFVHPAFGERTWAEFQHLHQERTIELWAYINDTARTWFSLLGFAGVVFAAFISSKYRLLILSLPLCAVPYCIAMRWVAPPMDWAYVLFPLHLSSGIALFYGMKFLQEKVYEGLSKWLRTSVAALAMLIVMAWWGRKGTMDRLERFPEAAQVSEWFSGLLKDGDRVLVEYPWDAPVEFHFEENGLPTGPLHNARTQGRFLYILVGPGDGQTLGGISVHHRNEVPSGAALEKVKDMRRLEVYRSR